MLAPRGTFAIARSGLPSPFRSPIATEERRCRCVVTLGPESAVAPVEEHGDGWRPRSRSPGPACRRRSGRRSRSNSNLPPLRSRAWPGSCRRPCSRARRRCSVRAVVRGRQVRLAVAVQVADRDRPGGARSGSRAWVGRLPSPVFRSTETRAPRLSFAVARSGLPSPFRSPIATERGPSAGCVVAPALEAAVASVQEHGDGVSSRVRGQRGPACRRRSGRRSRPTTGRVRFA